MPDIRTREPARNRQRARVYRHVWGRGQRLCAYLEGRVIGDAVKDVAEVVVGGRSDRGGADDSVMIVEGLVRPERFDKSEVVRRACC